MQVADEAEHGFDGRWYLESYDEMSGAVIDSLTVVIVNGWLFGLSGLSLAD